MDKQYFNELLKKANLSKKEFANIVGASPASIGNWGTSGRDIPYWVETWLKMYIENKDFQDFKAKMKMSGICE